MSLQNSKKNIVFIDSRVEDYQILLQELDPTAEGIVLDENQDAIQAITSLLSERKNLQSIHIISHGSPATIKLGKTELNANTLTQYTPQIQQWQTAFTKNTDLLLYGCNIAQGSVGKSFIHQLAELTQTQVAASKNLTGNPALGGNWNLEITTGKITTPLCLSQKAIANYQGILTEPAINFTGANSQAEESSYEAPGANNPNTIYTLNFAGNNNNFGSFDVVISPTQTDTYEIIKNLDFLEIQRKDNPDVQGIRDILWFDGSANGTTINLNSGYKNSMEVALRTPILNLGTDNIFTNTGNSNGNNNNIERIDFIEPGGLIAPTINNNIGFVLVERGNPGVNDPVIISPILEIDQQNNPTQFGDLINISEGEWGNSGLPDVIPQIFRQDENQNEMRWATATTTQSIGGVYISFADLGINPGETFYGYAIFPADVTADMDLIGLSDVPLNTNQELGGLDLITGGLLASAVNIAPTSSDSNVITPEDTPYTFIAGNFPFADLNTGDTLQQVKITSLPTQGTLQFGNNAVTINQEIPIAQINQLTFSSSANANGENYANFNFQVGDGTDFSGNKILSIDVTPVNDAPEINNLNNNPNYTLGENPVVLDQDAIINDVELDTANNYTGATLTLIRSGGANAKDVFSGSGTLGTLTPGENLTLNSTVIGTVTDNSGGQLLLTFNNVTADQVHQVLQQIAYSNSGDTPETVSLQYTFNDGNTGTQGTGGALTSTGSLSVNVNAAPNQAPTAENDTVTTQQNTALTLTSQTLLNNDTDPEGDTLTVENVSNPSNGTVELNPQTGEVIFTPTPGYSGSASFDYTVNDGNGGTSSATVNITVEPLPNQAPTAENDTATTQQNTAVTLTSQTLLNNDTDPEGDTLTVENVSNPSNGTVELNPQTGEVIFTPTPGYSGSASFDYTVNDGNGGTSTATVNITVEPLPNQAPTLVDDTVTTQQNTALTLTSQTLLNNDTDPEDDTLTLEAVNNPSNGTVELNPDTGEVIFTPTAGYSGPASFDYTVNDGNGGTSTATVNITVEPLPNQAPTLVDDTATTQQDTPVVVTPLNNDTDPEGDTLTVENVSNPSNGTVELNPDTGEVIFTPTAGYSGSASFDYTVNDGNGGTSTATVNITVEPLPNQAPTAENDTATTQQNTALTLTSQTLLNNDTDPEGDTLTVENVSNPSNGTVELNPQTGEVIFTPTPGYSGSASFDYTVNDGNGGTSSATVNITVEPLPNQAPTLVDDTVTTQQNTALTLTSQTLLNNDTDPEGDTLTVENVSNPSNGTVELNPQTGEVIFTPTPGYSGSASFDYTVNDGNGGTSSATVNITVEPLPNQAPTLVDDTVTTQQNTALTLTSQTLLNNDTDPEGDTLTVENVSNPSNGTVELNPQTGEVIFTPTPGYSGSASFDYTVNDGNGGTSTATVNITVEPLPNQAPTATNDIATTQQNTALTLTSQTLLNNDTDPEGDTLTVENVSNPSNGTVELTPDKREVIFTPTAGYSGLASFEYTVNDGNGGTSSATVNISVETPPIVEESPTSQPLSPPVVVPDDECDLCPPLPELPSLVFPERPILGLSSSNIATNTVNGTNENDNVLGTPANDNIFSFGGDDFIDALPGNDNIYSGDGDDSVDGGEGTAWMEGGQGNDQLRGSFDNDTLQGQEGNDSLFGGVDNIPPISGRDITGQDWLSGGNGDDFLSGNENDDTLIGDEGNDMGYGGKNNDLIFGDLGNDTLCGDLNNDTLIGSVADGTVALEGEEEDVLYGYENNDLIQGGIGNDTIYAGEGDDFVFGGQQDDLLRGELGRDTVYGDEGNDTLFGGYFSQDMLVDPSQDLLWGGSGDDVMYGNLFNDTLIAGEGNDTLYGGEEDDILYGENGDDLIYGDQGSDILCGGDGDDTLYGGTGETGNIQDTSELEKLQGGAGNDILSANEGIGELCGDEGNDTLYGGKQTDTLKGGANDDWLFSDLGNDSLTGESGSDRFVIAADTGLDQISDFQIGQDLIVLTQGLTFDQLTLTQDGISTLISVNNQPLVMLNNIQAELMTSNMFEAWV